MKTTTETRRRFLFQATSSVGLMLTAPMIASIVSGCETDETAAPDLSGLTVVVADYPELSVVGGITTVILEGLNNSDPVFISRIDVNTYAVFSAICTHQGCQVFDIDQQADSVECPCHNARYAKSDGSVVQQPDSGEATDLPRFPSTFNSSTGILTINP
ncbi:MAG: ubiquinol-cytochrome c reductase iron-sulfur subunit [Candidatus Kapaibacteriota bacterium]|jgi:Rieske Fe-S protein